MTVTRTVKRVTKWLTVIRAYRRGEGVEGSTIGEPLRRLGRVGWVGGWGGAAASSHSGRCGASGRRDCRYRIKFIRK